MAEIPDLAWIGIGIFVAITSLFLGFLRPVDTSSFFKLMLFVGIGMVIYGFIKFKIRTRKKPEQMMRERRQQRMQQRGPSEVNIDIEDYRKNPQLREQVMKGHHPKYPQETQQKQRHHQAGKSKFCPQCGSPLLPKHKFCPICGAKI